MHEGPVVVFSGGGTGGHLYPALAIADALRRHRPDVRAIFFGAERGLEARVLPERGEHHVLLPVHGIDRSRPLRSWRAVWGLTVSVARVARVFRRIKPEAVVVTGGYAAAPAGLVAGLAGVPLVLQEQNSVPGVVTKLLTRWATQVHVAYPEAVGRLPLLGDQARVSGNPVRSVSTSGGVDARTSRGIPRDAVLVLVAGGSQGSLALNRVVGEAVRAWVEGSLARPASMHLLWVTGPRNLVDATDLVAACGSPDWVHVTPYLDDMPAVLVEADLAVSRAGAMSTAELLNAGLPSVLVPLPTAAEDHQTQNALALEGAGVAVVAPEVELTAARLAGEIDRLLASPGVLSRMREAALAMARPDAAERIAADVARLLSAPEGVR